jgi:class 3 adenylate cyclase
MYTKTIVETSADNMVKFKTVIRGVADSVTIAGLKDHTVPSIFSDIPRSFPYVRVPQFEVVAAEARQLSASESIVWTPFVDDTQRNAWANFASLNANGPNGWLNESRQALAKHPDDHYFEDKEKFVEGNISQVVFRLTDEGDMEEVKGPGIMAPLWQMSPPPPDSSLINYDLMDETQVPPVIPVLNATRQGFFLNIDPDLGRKVSLLTPSNDGHDEDHPHSTFVQPVLSSYESNATLVGFVAAIVSWDDFLSRLVPDGINGIVAVLRNSCGDIRTYVLKGRTAEYVGPTDMHDSDYDDTEVVVTLTDFSDDIDGQCDYSVHLYSSSEYDNTGNSNLPVICTIIVGCIFLLMGITFFIYDRFVTRRNDKVIEAAAHSNKIISTLFPAQVRDRLFAEKEQNAKRPTNLKSMLTNGNFLDTRKDEDDDVGYKSKPIADLFPETTILFADISGFTAWSSVREPAQVFVLLETLFRAFDDIAKKRRVFKVETVGDCYVAVTGLPEPRKDHAVAMCRFARDCLLKMRVLAKKLEVTLGPGEYLLRPISGDNPVHTSCLAQYFMLFFFFLFSVDTGDLAMRMGIHSGAVTAGVLRGERSRFQLFGDTMNTAARMEHTGIRDRIQLSQETADLLIAAGKSNWIAPRNDIIVAKGKGEMQTYWLELTNRAGDGVSTTDASSNGSASVCGEVEAPDMTGVHDAKTMRLIDWNVDVLLRLLKQIVARRNACPPVEGLPPYEARFSTENGSSTIDEVREIIKLPRFNKAAAMKQEDPENVVLDPKVAQQLHSYVCNIAAIYRENPFHNFEVCRQQPILYFIHDFFLIDWPIHPNFLSLSACIACNNVCCQTSQSYRRSPRLERGRKRRFASTRMLFARSHVRNHF